MPAGTITALVKQAHDDDRVNVYIDGAWAIGIDLSTLQQEGLYRGKVLAEADWQRLEQAAADRRCYAAALRLIDARPRTEHELRDRLTRKEFEPTQIDGVIRRLRDLQLLDDRAFARLWVEQRAAHRPKGAMVLRQELVAKGVDRATAAAIVADSVTQDDEAQSCEQVARQVVRRYRDAPDRLTFQRKLGTLLQRRGYRLDTIRPIVNTLWAEIHAASGHDDDVGEDA